MRFALDSDDVPVSDAVLTAIGRTLSERVNGTTAFAGARDLRLRLRQTKNALLCVAAVGFASGSLATSTARGTSPFEAIVGALDDLPARIDRLDGARRSAERAPGGEHVAVRDELRRMLDGRA